MGITVSVLVQLLEQFDPSSGGLQLHGANLTVASTFRNLLANPRIDSLEIFLSPDQYQRQAELPAIAQKILPPSRVGKGALRFYSIYDLPEIWSDGTPRVLLCLDPQLWDRNRYVRDQFAQGPVVLSCQTHGMGDPNMYLALSRVAQAEPVEYDLLMCLSQACKESFAQTFNGYLCPTGSPLPCRMEVLPNTVDPERFRPHTPDEKKRVRQLLGLPVEGTIALFLGRLSANSKADLLPLIRQFARVSRSTDYLLIVGPENMIGYADKLAELAQSLGIEDRVIIREAAQPWAAPMVYGAADLYVFPSDNVQECLANTVLEAMATGLPVLSSDWDGMRDTVVHDVTGFLVPTYFSPGLQTTDAFSTAVPFMSNMLMLSQSAWVDAPVLGDRLHQLLRDSELRKTMGQAGRARIEQHFLTQQVQDRLLEIWESCLQKAIEEPVEHRERRRAFAYQVGHPMPAHHLYSCYASQAIDPEKTHIRLSDLGSKVVAGKSQLAFYDETLPLVRAEVVDALFRYLSAVGTNWQSVGEVLTQCSQSTRICEDRVMFHIALLLKRDMLDLRVEGPKIADRS